MLHILLIEDNFRLMKNLVEILGIYGYQVSHASDGLEGYDKTISLKPDLVICDLVMPKMGGFEFNARVRDSGMPEIPIILLTGRTDFDDREKLEIARFYAYLKKPFLSADLIAIIKECTGEK